MAQDGVELGVDEVSSCGLRRADEVLRMRVTFLSFVSQWALE